MLITRTFATGLILIIGLLCFGATHAQTPLKQFCTNNPYFAAPTPPAGYASGCFPTLEAAEAFARQDPTPMKGRPLLEEVPGRTIASGPWNLNYAIGLRSVIPAGDWYWGFVIYPGSPRNCETRVPVFPANIACATEGELATYMLNRYPYGPPIVDSAVYIGGYLSTPDYWDPADFGTPSDLSQGRSLVYANYNRTGAGQRQLQIYDERGVLVATNNVTRDNYSWCPLTFNALDPASSIANVWPNVCYNAETGTIQVTQLNQVASCSKDGNPCIPSTGNKELHETDFTWGSVSFTRHYNSLRDLPALSGMGLNWTHSLTWLVLPPGTPSDPSIYIQDDQNHAERYNRVTTGLYRSENEVGNVLTQLSGGSTTVPAWKLQLSSGRELFFNSLGRLLQIQTLATPEKNLTLSYCDAASFTAAICNVNDALISAQDGKGRTLTFQYSPAVYSPDGLSLTSTPSRLISVTADGVMQVRYAYDSLGRLSTITYPALTGTPQRTLFYAEADHLCRQGNGTATPTCPTSGFPYHLTGIRDENGVRFADYTYDHLGRVTSSSHANGAERVTLNYTGAQQTQVTTSLGDVKTYNFQTDLFRHTGNSSDGAGLTQRHYNTDNRIDSVIDANGNETRYEYNSTDRTATTVAYGNAVARRTETDWHATFKVPIERRTYNASHVLQTRSTWTYNSRGQVLSKTEFDPIASHAARVWTYAYCEAANVTAGTCPLVGLLTQVNGPRSDAVDITNYTYRAADDPTCATAGACTYRRGDLWKVTNALGQITETVSYDKNGRATRTKDVNGTITDLNYHPRGWLALRTVRANTDGSASALDATTTFTYDAGGNVTRVTQPDGAYLNYTYDNAHRLTDIADNLNNHIHYTLDAAGNRTQENTYDPSSVLKRTLSRSYSSLNRLQRTTDALSHISTFGYDPNGNATSNVDALNTETDQQYDPLNRLVRTLQDVTAPTGTSTRNTTTQYTYDTRDNLTDVTDPDNLITHYVYDGQNNLTQLQSPDTGTTSYTVDAAGNRTSQTDARGITTNYSYDALNRLTAIRYPTASLNVAFQYDTSPNECGVGETFAIGRLAKMIDASGETHYCYDRRGNPTRKVQLTNLSFSCGLNTCGGGTTSSVDQSKRGIQSAIIAPGPPNPTNTTVLTLTTRYGYTLADRLSSMTYPSGLQVTYVRNAIGQISQIGYKPTPTAASTTILNSATYLPFGPINTLTFGNGRRQTKSYDQNYGIDAISSTSAGGLTLDFSLDAVGNVQDASNALGLTPPTQRYRYDDLYRLTEVDNSAATMLEGYTYTKTGDRTRKSKQGQADQIYIYPISSHRLQSVAGTPRTYDADGNLTSQNLSYDARNRLAGWQLQADGTINLVNNSTQYQYNGKGERVAKQSVAYSSGTSLPGDPSGWILGGYAYSYGEGGQITGEYSVTGQAIVEYLYLDNQPIAIQKANKLYYIETDHLNTPRQVIDPTRNATVWRWDFFGSAFGDNAPSQDPDSDGIPFILNLRFPGQYYDQEIGLSYNYFRDYEASTGRYVESDPVGLKGGANTYDYVLSNPTRWVDANGLIAASISCGGARGITQCDGNGNYEILNCNKSCSSKCTQVHEEVHAYDFKKRWGANSCRNMPKGKVPSDDILMPHRYGPGNNQEFRTWSECRSHCAGKKCAESMLSEECSECSKDAKEYKDHAEGKCKH